MQLNIPNDTEASLWAGGVTTETKLELAVNVSKDKREVIHCWAATNMKQFTVENFLLA